MIYSIVRASAFLTLRILFRIKVSGIRHIPKKGGFILVSNHVSYLDPIVLGAVCPRKLSFMTRHDLFNIPIFSKLISLLGAFPVKRNTADPSAVKVALKRLKHGSGLVLFPEGSRRIDGQYIKPQPGVGFLATKTKVPVVPSFIKGTDLALPKGAKLIRFKRINVYFGEQVHIEKESAYNYRDIAEEIMYCVRRVKCE